GRAGARRVAPGPSLIAKCGHDVLGMLTALKIEGVKFCGPSTGGMIGMWLALNAANRIDRLVLANTAPKIGTPEIWNTRIENVRKGGMEAIADTVIERWYTPEFRARAPDKVAQTRAMLVASPPEGYIASCAAVREMDQRAAIRTIRQPTLVIAGAHDMVTPPAECRGLAAAIAGACIVELDAAHISNIEAADRFTAELMGFLPG